MVIFLIILNHLKKILQIYQKVTESNADMGIAVDPDVDRLVFMCENGELFGEENTLVKFVLIMF